MSDSNDARSNLERLNKSNFKLYIMSIIVGILTGLAVTAYRWILEEIEGVRRNFTGISALKEIPQEIIIVVFICFILVGLIVDYLYKKYPTTSGSGIPQVKALILGKLNYKNWWQEFIAKFVGGFLGIGAGLSLGREGPSVQLGSYLGFGISKILKQDTVNRNYLVTAGASAGLAGAFGAPLAGVMFSIEELHRYISTKMLICIFLSSIFADFTGRRFFGIATSFHLDVKYEVIIGPYLQFFLYILLAIVVAFLGKLFTYCLIKSQDLFAGLKVSRTIKISVIMSIAFLLCNFLPEVTGGGHSLVEEISHTSFSVRFLVLIFIVKLLFTTTSYSTGFAGGIFLPMLVLGALSGKIFSTFLSLFMEIPHFLELNFIVLGMAAFFVAVVRAPITGTILILEMTGSFGLLLALSTVSAISFLITEKLKLEPIYEILYERMKKDDDEESKNKSGKTLITLTVMSESLLEGKMVSEIMWPEDVLVVSIIRSGVEKIPKGRTQILAGDSLVLLLPENKVSEVKEKILRDSMQN